MTMNGIIALTLRYFTEFSSFGADYVNVVDDRPTMSATKMPRECSFLSIMICGNIRRSY